MLGEEDGLTGPRVGVMIKIGVHFSLKLIEELIGLVDIIHFMLERALFLRQYLIHFNYTVM